VIRVRESDCLPTPDAATLALMAPSHSRTFLSQTAEIAGRLDDQAIERMVERLAALRARGGRLFVIGVGGSAANCSHAVNDLRKLCGIDAVTPVDNVAELTARTNDEGWETVFAAYLRTSRADGNDGVLVFSVGGGDAERNVSANIVRALDEAKLRGMTIMGVVGRDGGHTARVGDVVVVVPTVDPAHITPHAEAFQAVVWHCIVSHPTLKAQETKWEGLARPARAPG